MKNTLKLLTLMLLLALLLLPTSAVYARGSSSGLLDGRVIFGDNFTLESGDTLTGDLVVFGGNVEIDEEATVQGDMVVIGGNVTLDGTVSGSTVIVGGSTSMSETAVVQRRSGYCGWLTVTRSGFGSGWGNGHQYPCA